MRLAQKLAAPIGIPFTGLFTFLMMSATIHPLQNTLSAQVDRTKPPVLGEPKSITLPPVTVRQLANGLKLMVVERHELPIADFILVLPVGAAANPADRAGVADLTAQMLLAGTTTRTALEIDDHAAYLGVNLNAQSGWDATYVSLTTPTAQLDSALALMADIVLRPSFPVEEFDRMKQERLTALLQLKDRGSAVADRAYATILFGSDHPYGRPASGTEESVGTMTVDDVKSFYNSHFAPNSATLIAVGDITPDELEAKVNALYGAWEKGGVPAVTVVPPSTPSGTRIYLIDKPGAAQSSFRIGSVGVARSTPDYFPIEVMNTILGGAFTSRLNLNLRETKGYTYGAGSRFDMRKGPGPFTARSEIVAAMSDSALLEFMKELRAIRDTVPTDELTKAKQYLMLQLPSAFESTRDVAQQLVTVALYGLPLDYYNQYSAKINAVTQQDVQSVAQRYINPDNLAIVIVGDLKVIEPKLRALNLAPIEIRDINGAAIRN